MMSERVTYLAANYRKLADKYYNESPGKSYVHYLLCIQLMPQWKNELRDSFSSVLCSFGKVLEHEERYNELFTAYEQALNVFPDDVVILNNLGAHLCRLEQLKEALIYFKNALRINPYYLPAFRNLEITKSHLVERWHFRMLNDSLRNESYEKSICKKINDFKSVLDIGTGTGLLSIYAKKAGAVSIYSCDYSPTMIAIAEKVLSANFLTDSIVLINKLSNEISVPDDIPQRLSMAVTETFDGGLLGEHILQTLIHAWENLLKPQTNKEGQFVQRVIPHSAVLFITPIESLDIARKNYLVNSTRIERNSNVEGLNLLELELFTVSTEPYDTENLKNIKFNTLGETHELFEFNFNNVSELKQFYNGEKDKHFNIILNKQGFCDALAVWFKLMLDPETIITSSPFSNNACCWEQAIFPLKNECSVREDSSMSAMASCAGGILSVIAKDKKNENAKGVTQPIIRLLNSETLLMTYIQILNYIKTVLPSNEQISVLDLSWFPYIGLLITKYFNGVICASSQHLETLPFMKEFFICNDIDENKINFKKWTDMLELLEQEKITEKYNIILIDVLTTAGEIDEQVITLIPLLRNLLDSNGLFLPSKLTICCQLIFSEELANISQMKSDKDEFNIAKFINEYKVSHMVDFKLEELKYHEMSSSFPIAVLDMNNIVNETLMFEKEIEIPKPGSVNAVLYWYSINYTSDIQFSTVTPDSPISQAAMLLDNSINIERNMKLKLSCYYNSGAMKFVVI